MKVPDLPAFLDRVSHHRSDLLKLKGSGVGMWCALLLVLSTCQLAFFLGGLPRSLHGCTDFRAFYGAGRLVLEGQGSSLYRHGAQEQIERSYVSAEGQTLAFLYPPFAALLFVPLALLPYKIAFVFFTLISLTALLFASAYLGDKGPKTPALPYWLVPLCAVCVVPVLMSLLQGQLSLLLLLLYTVSHIAFSRGRPVFAGLLLSLALIKWQMALPVLFLLAAWRRWRVIGFATAGAAILFCVSLGVTGMAGVREYAQSVLQIAGRTAGDPEGAKALYGMFAADMPNLHGMFFVLTGGRPFGLALTAISSLAILFSAFRRPPSLPLALTAAMLVSYHMQAYDLTLLALPIGIAGCELLRANGQEYGQRPKRRVYLLYGAVVLLVAPLAPLLIWLHSSWLLIIAAIAMFVYPSPEESVTL